MAGDADGQSKSLEKLHADHSRHWRHNLYVYPVISRRSGGLSIGVNLNPDKVCNFNCIYCQVDRHEQPDVRRVDLDRLRKELETLVALAVSGDLFNEPPFDQVPTSHRCICDIAFSGDGEPTASPQFPAAVQMVAEVRRAFGLNDVKLLLITNAALLDQSAVRDTLAVMDDSNGEIWAKLDAGTETYFKRINRAHIPLSKVIESILDAARVRPLVIQSLWMKVYDEPPPEVEVDAFADRLNEILTAGGRLKSIQVYTTARQAAEPYVTPLSTDQLQAIADRIRAAVDVPVETFGG